MIQKLSRCLINIILLFFSKEICALPVNLENLPTLNCRVESTTGNFFGYLPPKIGDYLQFSFKDAFSIKDKLTFKSGNYIPLNGQLKAIKEVYSHKGVIEGLRFLSGDGKQWSVTIDILSLDNFKTPRANIFIFMEQSLVNSIAVLKCQDN